jgi:hypothetical protein
MTIEMTLARTVGDISAVVGNLVGLTRLRWGRKGRARKGSRETPLLP